MTELNTVKQITLRGIGLKIPVGGGEFLGKTVAMVSGRATGYHMKSTNYGESVCLNGEFVAINAITGEVFDGVQLYMPDDFARALVNKLEKSEQGVEFEGVQIQVAGSEKAGRGYTFITRNVQTQESINAKKAWAEKMLSQVKALPAPAKAKSKAA